MRFATQFLARTITKGIIEHVSYHLGKLQRDQLRTASVLCLLFITLFLCTVHSMAHPGFDARVELLNQKLKESPANPLLYLQRAELYRRHAEYDKALADLDCAERYGVARSDLLIRRSEIYEQVGDVDAANALLDERLKSDPADHAARLRRAKLPGAEGKERLDDLILLNKAQAELTVDAQFTLAQEYGKQFPKNCARATQSVKTAIETGGAQVSLISLAVDMCEERGDSVTAITFISYLPENLQQTPQWLYRVATLYEKNRNDDKAKHYYRRALAAINALPPARRNTSALTALKKEIIIRRDR